MADNVIAGIRFGSGTGARVVSTDQDIRNGLTRVKTNMGIFVFRGSQPLDSNGFETGVIHRVTNDDVEGGSDKYFTLASEINIPMTFIADENTPRGIGISSSKGNIKINAKNGHENLILFMDAPNARVVEKDDNDEIKVKNFGKW